MKTDRPYPRMASVAAIAIAAGLLASQFASPVQAAGASTGDRILIVDGKETDIQVMPDFVLNESVDVVGNDSVRELRLSDGDRLTKRTPRASGCSWRTWVAPASYSWHTSVNGCSLIGTTATAFAGYNFTVDGNSQGRGCLKGRGYYYQSYPGGGSWYQTYRSIGCASGGSSGSGSVLWGKVASVKKVQMYAASAPVAAAGMFK